MKITIVPSAVGDATSTLQYAISYIVNDAVAMDAGAIGLWLAPADQQRLRHVLISHSHMDHVASLPFFLENTFDSSPDCASVYGSQATLQALQEDVFNQRMWPDFIALSETEAPFLRLIELRPNEPLLVDLADAKGVRTPSDANESVPDGWLKITPVSMNHVVPTLGFIFEDATGSVAIASDTAPTEDFWTAVRPLPRLRAVILEASFPDGMYELAGISKHLTPALFAGELAKLNRPETPVLAVHLKPKFHDAVARQLAALGLPQVEIARPGRTYEF